MPSRKQRRRREKLKRHEYEYVIETEEGDEVVVERPTDGAKSDERAKTELAPRDRRGREMPKPSMGRVLRRTAIFAPLILVVVYLMGGTSTTGQKIGSAVTLIAFFIPFSYLIDLFMYRMLQRRQQRARASRN